MRIPVAFDGCFGWLHTPPDGLARDTAVLLCPGILKDAMLAHCSWRLLADRLAEAGYTTLRFDYPGTGDSCDEQVASAGGHWPAWRASIERAADWLKSVSGARRLVLGGLRLGASLATLTAAQRRDVEGLLLFEPVTNGRTYLRQLVLEAELVNGAPAQRGQGIELRELSLSPSTLDDLQKIDLRVAALPARLQVAVFARTKGRALDECAEAWRQRGVAVALPGWQGLEPLVHHIIQEDDRLADFATALAWLKSTVPSQTSEEAIATPLPAQLNPPGCREEALCFGENGRLFGVLCRPAEGSASKVVIMGNAGRDPHYGAARQNVALARRLARLGIASLRMDFVGLGDSIGPAGEEDVLSNVLRVERTPDLRAAIDALQRVGFETFILQGLCSGGYHAFHAALGDARVEGLILVNLPIFELPRGDVLSYIQHRDNSPLYYLRRLVRPQSWTTLLEGRLDLRGALRGQWGRLRLAVSRRLRRLLERIGLADTVSFAHRSMADLSARGVRTLFLLSPGAGEVDAFAREFGPAGEGLAGFRGAAMRIIDVMDHDLVRSAGREIAVKAMVDFAAGRAYLTSCSQLAELAARFAP